MKFYDNVASALSKRGMNLMVGDLYDQQAIWKQWYRGNVNDFHYYNIVVNGKKKRVERKTLNAPKKFCEDIAKLLWTEKTQINLDNEEATKKLWDILDSKKNSLTVNLPIFLEKGLALGGGALVEYFDGDGDPVIDYVPADSVIPFKYTNSYINGIVTLGRTLDEQDSKNKKYYTMLTIHKYEGGVYTRENELYLSENETDLGKQIPLKTMYPNVKEKESIETETPRFQYFKPNIANNLDVDSPMGISIFANCLDIFKSIDAKYDGFYNEFILGKKRIMIDASVMKRTNKTRRKGQPYTCSIL